MTAILNFENRFWPNGFSWEKLPKNEEPRIREPWNPLGEATPRIELVTQDIGERARVAPTVLDSGLFRNMARLEPTPEQILAFAGRYGSLWTADHVPFSEWEYEVRTLRFVLQAWDAVVEKKRGGIIAEHFKPDAGGSVSFPFFDSLLRYEPFDLVVKKTARAKSRGAVWGTLGVSGVKASPLDAARRFVVEAINARLVALGVDAKLSPAEATRLTFCPRNLLGAIWLQFAMAVSESKEYRFCDVCGRAFELDPDVNRISRFYCDNACRVKAYRVRKSEAKKLHKRGKTPKQIADQIGSDIDTVKTWLKGK